MIAPVPQPKHRRRRSLATYFRKHYVPDRLPNSSRSTLHQYQLAINKLCCYVARDVTIGEVKPGMLHRFAGWARMQGLNPETVRQYVVYIRAIVRHARPTRFPKRKTGRPAREVLSAPAPGPMTRSLIDQLRAYRLEREIARGSIYQLTYTIQKFSEFLGHEAMLEDFTKDNLNGFLVWRADARLSPSTLKGNRVNLLTIWRWAYENELLAEGPRRIRKIHVPQTMPEAWSLAQLGLLLDAATRLSGEFHKIPVRKADFWRALIMTAYDSALRTGDLLRLRHSQIDDEGRFVVTQDKTAWPIMCRLGADTIAAIDATGAKYREFIFGGFVPRENLTHQFRTLVKAAGLRGTMRWLRRTSASLSEAAVPGSAMSHLGHKTAGLAYRFYVDPRLLTNHRPLLPRIGEGGAA